MNAPVKGVKNMIKFVIFCEDDVVLYEYGKSFQDVKEHVEKNFDVKVKRIEQVDE